MTTHEGKWPAGTPCWIDLMAGDVERTRDFYTRLLGWTYTEPVPDFGNYQNALLNGQPVAGLSPTTPDWAEFPHVWTVYLATDDITATRESVVAAGGGVISEPMTLPGLGAMAIFTDPNGDIFGVWQSGSHTGFTVVDEPGVPSWMDLMTADSASAKTFYAAVFGFQYADNDEVGRAYATYEVPGSQRPAGGIGDLGPLPARSGWTVCFQVGDVDAAAARLAEYGGALVVEPYDFAYGRIAEGTGPDGEPIYLLTPMAMA